MPSADDSFLLARRLTAILIALNYGRKLDPAELATEFGVSRRTIQRDPCERFQSLNLERADAGLYRLLHPHLGTFSFDEIERFATPAGIRPLYPWLSHDFVHALLHQPTDLVLLVKGTDYEDLDGKQPNTFRRIEDAIQRQRCISFFYRKSDGAKAYSRIEPYRLINHSGIFCEQ